MQYNLSIWPDEFACPSDQTILYDHLVDSSHDDAERRSLYRFCNDFQQVSACVSGDGDISSPESVEDGTCFPGAASNSSSD